MKTIIIYVAFLLSVFTINTVNAQKQKITEQEKIENIEKTRKEAIENATKEEKHNLEKEIRYIDNLVREGKLSKEEGEEKKKKAAKRAAENIKNRIAIAENNAELLLREQEDTTSYHGSYLMTMEFAENGKIADLNIKKRINDTELQDPDTKRTKSDLVLAFGFNNALEDGQSINDSDFKLAGSRFFEIGLAWTTRVFENSNWLRVKYGFSFQLNGLKPTDNRYFVQDGDITRLEEFEYDLDKSKFRMDNLVMPIHFEIGPSSRGEANGYRKYSTEGKFKIGFGGYGGFNIGERQKLKFNDGDDQKKKNKSSFNTNDLVYGLSGYLSFGGTALYAKYDLNPIFSSPNTELNNFSLGLRFDVD